MGNDKFEAAKKKLADAVPGAIDGMIELATDAKAEPIRLQAIKAVIETNEGYEKTQREIELSEANTETDTEIIRLLKEYMRKNVFMEMRALLSGDVSPQKIVELREQVDALFGRESYAGDVSEAEIVDDSDYDDL